MIFRIKLTANGAATMLPPHEGSEENINAYHLFRKTTEILGKSTVNLSSHFFYEEDGLFNKDIHIISHFPTSN